MYLNEYLLSDSSQMALRLAAQFANEYSHAAYSPEHLLLAMVQEDVGLHPVLAQLDKEPSEIHRWAISQIDKLPKSTRYVAVAAADDRAVTVLKETQKLCLRYGHSEIEPIDMLEAICTPEVGFKSDVLRRFPLALYELIDWRGKNASAAIQSGGGAASGKTGAASPAGNTANAQQILEKYCEDWSLLAQQDKIDPIIGRDKEIKQLVEILGKRLSPNVLIVGEPGVGKTALVGGLALQILKGNVPEKLKSATIFELDVNGRLVAGAFKGEVEERLKSVLKAIKGYGNKAILFIDEIHVLLDERGSVGSGVVNLLKPELARGELTVIGATTQNEYQKYIEKDSAFNRRFSRLTVGEPDEALAITMLHGLMPKYEAFHGLKADPGAISQAVKMAKRYIGDKNLPVSAIELLDFSMACASQMNSTSKSILDEIETGWKGNDQPNIAEYRQAIRDRMSELLIGKLGDEINTMTVPETIETLRKWTKDAKKQVDPSDVDAMIAYRTGIPIGRLQSKEQDKLRNAKALLQQRVVGQDHVLDSVEEGLKIFRANLKDPREPGAIFFFTGPTGTGKTELAKAIAELLFDDENAIIRFDMSEFQESHSVAAMLGSPPGYVGYEEGGILINKVRKQPYSVVLFDEIEKAHQDIYGIFLQMLTDSRLTDKQGKLADFSNTIIIFTSNAGAHEIIRRTQAGKRPDAGELKEILRETKHFKDEFLGRVDRQILPFDPINETAAKQILSIHFNKFVKLVKTQHNVKFSVSEKVMQHLIDIGFSPMFGARPLRNAIKTFLAPPVADKIIRGEITKGDEVKLDIDEKGELVWDIKKAS